MHEGPWSCRRPGGTDDAGRRERTEPDTKSLRGATDLGDHGVDIGDRMAAQLHRVDNGHAGATNIDGVPDLKPGEPVFEPGALDTGDGRQLQRGRP